MCLKLTAHPLYSQYVVRHDRMNDEGIRIQGGFLGSSTSKLIAQSHLNAKKSALLNFWKFKSLECLKPVSSPTTFHQRL
jgi:hypothetical protein